MIYALASARALAIFGLWRTALFRACLARFAAAGTQEANARDIAVAALWPSGSVRTGAIALFAWFRGEWALSSRGRFALCRWLRGDAVGFRTPLLGWPFAAFTKTCAFSAWLERPLIDASLGTRVSFCIVAWPRIAGSVRTTAIFAVKVGSWASLACAFRASTVLATEAARASVTRRDFRTSAVFAAEAWASVAWCIGAGGVAAWTIAVEAAFSARATTLGCAALVKALLLWARVFVRGCGTRSV